MMEARERQSGREKKNKSRKHGNGGREQKQGTVYRTDRCMQRDRYIDS